MLSRSSRTCRIGGYPHSRPVKIWLTPQAHALRVDDSGYVRLARRQARQV